ncbi:MAG: porin family protein [Bacteroidota bacterium]
MKKIIGFIVAGLLGMLAVQSQAQPIPLGVKIGPNFSRLQFDPGFDRDGKLGFHMGVLSKFELAEDLYFQPEVLLSLQGNDRVNSTNLILPLLINYEVIDQFSLHLGVQPGILVGAEEDFRDITKVFDLGVPFGLEYHPKKELSVGVRYVPGVSNINDINSDQFKTFNRVVQFFVAYWIRY